MKKKGEELEIKVKDNGKVMPKEMAEKLLKGEEIGTTKKDGYGIDATDNGNDKSNEKQARDRFKRRRMDSIYSYISKKREANTRWFVDKI